MATLAPEPPIARWRPRRRLWWTLAAFVTGSVLLSAIAGWRDDHALFINQTDSLPNWAFVIHRNATPTRGEYVFFLPPQGTLVQRHFGPHPQMFGKIVYGMPGDVVAHVGRAVLINGRPVARMKPLTRLGEPLTPGTTGTIPAGCYFAGTPHPDGFDSRYADIGLVCGHQLVGTGKAIL